MGLRGPGAKPVKKATVPATGKRQRKPRWQWQGLSRAERVAAFIESLTITSGTNAGQQFKLRPWQRDIINSIYAINDDGKRLIRTALITVPRKNGKTQLAAALALAHLAGPEAEPRGQVFSAAASRDQAGLIFREMRALILADEALSDRIIIREFTKTLEDTETGSTYAALSSDAKKAHGLSASFFVYDELAQSLHRHLYDALQTSTGARAEPLGIVISTQSSDPHHVMSELVDYGRQVRDGVIDDRSFLPVIYEAPETADPWAEDTWFACNPALDDFRSLEEMRTAAQQAQRIPAREAVFRNLYLNQPIEADARFIAQSDWMACQSNVTDSVTLRGRRCWAGLDLASTTDLTALILYFPDDNGVVLPFFWIPRDNITEREDTDRVPYRTWTREGHIEATEGRAIDKLAIVRRLAKITSTYDVQGIAYDRWRIEDLNKLLADEGINLPMVPWGQGFKDMGPAVDALETAILSQQLRHPGNPVLTWNFANAVVDTDPAGARKLSKSKARERIDGAVALTMAVGLYNRQEAPPVYDFSGDRVLVA